MADRKIIFFDIDGTLVDHRGVFSDSARKALLAARARGHILGLATGRNRVQIYPALTAFAFDALVCATGAYVFCDEREVFSAEIPQDKLSRLLSYFEDNAWPIGLQGRDATYVTRRGYEGMKARFRDLGVAQAQIETILNAVTVIGDIRQAAHVEKMFYNRIGADVEEVQQVLGDYFLVTPSSFGSGEDRTSGEITIRGIDKNLGLQKAFAFYGMDSGDCIAFGDAGNDIPMLLMAGIGVAMGNAWPEVKEAADMVTSSIDEDGIALALERLGLI